LLTVVPDSLCCRHRASDRRTRGCTCMPSLDTHLHASASSCNDPEPGRSRAREFLGRRRRYGSRKSMDPPKWHCRSTWTIERRAPGCASRLRAQARGVCARACRGRPSRVRQCPSARQTGQSPARTTLRRLRRCACSSLFNQLSWSAEGVAVNELRLAGGPRAA
jgi:hypothetical protein